MTDDIRLTFGGYQGLATFAIGEHWWGPEAISASMTWRLGLNRTELQRRLFAALGPLMLHDTPGGREELREIVDPSLRDLVDDLLPVETAALSFDSTGTYFAGEAGGTAGVLNLVIRVRDGATVSWARRLGGEAARAVK